MSAVIFTAKHAKTANKKGSVPSISLGIENLADIFGDIFTYALFGNGGHPVLLRGAASKRSGAFDSHGFVADDAQGLRQSIPSILKNHFNDSLDCGIILVRVIACSSFVLSSTSKKVDQGPPLHLKASALNNSKGICRKRDTNRGTMRSSQMFWRR